MDIKTGVALIGRERAYSARSLAYSPVVFVNRLARKRELELENKKSELQTALEIRKTALQRELEGFNVDLDSKKSERGALLDYRHEVRKRLYTEFYRAAKNAGAVGSAVNIPARSKSLTDFGRGLSEQKRPARDTARCDHCFLAGGS